jgi:flavodoxin
MKALIIYVSMLHGNTKKVGEAMAEVLDASLLEPEEVHLDTLSEYDLIGFGSGIYWGRFYKRLRNFIKKLPNFQNKKAFIFGTCGHNEIPYKPIEKLLLKKGFNVVGKFSCLGFNTFFLSRILGRVNEGRPNREDFERAREFAKGLKEK